jgi:hypothetical protein
MTTKPVDMIAPAIAAAITKAPTAAGSKDLKKRATELTPGVTRVQVTVTLDGHVKRYANPTPHDRTKVVGLDNVTQWLLQRVNGPTYDKLIRNLADIADGSMKDPDNKHRIAEVTEPLTVTTRVEPTGKVEWTGRVIVEDRKVNTATPESITGRGMTLVVNEVGPRGWALCDSGPLIND